MVDPTLRGLVERHGGQLLSGGDAALIPGPGHTRMDRSLSLRIDGQGRILYHSFAGDDWRAVKDYLGLPEEAPDPRPKRFILSGPTTEQLGKISWSEDIWREAGPVEGSPAEKYLRGARRIPITLPSSLRFHPSAPLNYGRTRTSPALVAMISSDDGSLIGVHVTAIRPDGSGKAGDNPRRMFGMMKGGAVRLTNHHGRLAVAEGIETALSFQTLFNTPTWAALSSSGIEAFRPPRHVSQLLIAADGDDAGRRAAEKLRNRLQHHCRVTLATANDGCDWNDFLMEKSS